MLMQTIVTPSITYKQPLGLFIDGKLVKGIKGKTFETVNPTNEKAIVAVHEAGPEDVDLAVKAARSAFNGVWSKTTPTARGKMLVKLADLFDEHSDILAAIESLDNGKAITMAKVDIQIASNTLRYYGGWADKIHGQTIDTDADHFNYTKHEPIGVCGQIIPWNFPLVSLSWKIGPALACGNTVVLKTAEQTPLSGLFAATLIQKAGFPAGVVNILSGFGKIAGAAIAAHKDIDKIAFTGSTGVGRSILQAVSISNLKKLTLELGGKSANIVFNDADIEDAISWVHFGIFYNHGQVCSAGSRIYVQSGIYDEFVEAFKARASEIIVGDPFQKDTFQGPQVSSVQCDRIMDYIRSGKEAGAKIEIGGGRHGTQGYFIQPTIFSNVTKDMRIMKEEIFGPVCAICKFDTEEEVIRAANDSNYGLAAAIHTTDLNTTIRVSSSLKAGTVWVNTFNSISYQVPFGGFRESGMGRELGEYALSEYTQVKSVRIKLKNKL
ncbi:aldehyde dehydrogenase [Trichoderma arundinaceum]|uniref:Aldehyde dehydrogenase n=1 Tax=Trichoderma arundinaceum TaxID=490622 RepID=A0A395NJM4_TRIAR|nr:aldehyde dehydrogenase [Trichoderma arundinaceum]